jgi:hypothetical protein
MGLNIQPTEKTFIFNKYIYDLFGHVYQGFRQFMVNSVYDKFRFSVIETYDKAVEIIEQGKQPGGITSIPPRPALSVGPVFPINLDDPAGMELWRVSAMAGFQSNLYNPIYSDPDIRVVPTFMRFNLLFNASMWFQSIYQIHEMQVRLRFVFNNQERYVAPFGVQFYSPLPSIILQSGKPVIWSEYTIPFLYTVTGKYVNAYPIYVQPYIRLTSISDDTVKEEKSIVEYKLVVMFEMQIEIPMGFIIETLFKPSSIKFEIGDNSLGWSMVTSTLNLNDYDNTTMQCNTSSDSSLTYDSSNITGDCGIVFIGDNSTNSLIIDDNQTSYFTVSLQLSNSIEESCFKSTFNEKIYSPNIWFTFSVNVDICMNEVFYIKIPEFELGLKYVLISPYAQPTITWNITGHGGSEGMNVPETYNLMLNGPIMSGSKYVLYGFPPEYPLEKDYPNNIVIK